jgi:phosphatidate cytidylyltransferase
VSSFVSRLLVSLAGLPIVLGAAWLGGWALLALVAVASGVALHELFNVGRQLRPLALAAFVGGGATLLGAELGGVRWLPLGVPIALALALLFAAVADTSQSNTVAVATTVLGVVWIPLGLVHFVLIRDIPEHGRLAIFAVLLSIFATDTSAYLFGRVFGRNRLAPRVSPGKTWEGLLAGTVGGVFVAWVALYDEELLAGWQALLLGLVIVVAATLGDLLESLVKRDLGVKDTGRLLAGHGGLLDRIDSLLLGGPAAYYTLLAFGVVD